MKNILIFQQKYVYTYNANGGIEYLLPMKVMIQKQYLDF